jgi:protein TonB
MNRHFLLPVGLAAAAHGALLFGFSKQPRPIPAPKEITRSIPFVVREVAEEPVVVETERQVAAPKLLPDMPHPIRLPEPPSVDFTDRQTMKPPPFRPVGDKDVRALLDSDFGKPGGTGTERWGDILSTAHLDRTPHARFQSAPIYPFEAKRAGVSGEVQVEFIVDERGRVSEQRVVRSSDRIFEEATLRAVARWQFEPGRRHGKIVRFRMTVPVLFNLNEGL